MNTDQISKMTEKELFDACKEVLGRPYISCSTHLFGEVMSQLCEWGVSFERKAETKVYRLYKDDINFFGACVLSAFLRTAAALGKWEAPKMKEDQNIYYRIKSHLKFRTHICGPYENEEIARLSLGGLLEDYERVRVSPWEDNK